MYTTYISDFARRGYRTLLIGMKTMSHSEYKTWEEQYNRLNEELIENNSEEIEKCITELEQDLHLIGTTALEDRLQDNVYECIEEFRRANIKVWMITGDKLETAKNVGISCRLLQNPINRYVIRNITEENAQQQMTLILNSIKQKSFQNENPNTEENKVSSSNDGRCSSANKSNRVIPRIVNQDRIENDDIDVSDDIVEKFYDKNSKLDLAEKK